MANMELRHVIDAVVKDKGIDRAIIVEALEAAMLTAAKKKFGIYRDIEAHFNEDIGEVELFEFKEVVEEITDEHTQVTLEGGKQLDPDAELGDSLGVKLDTRDFGRIAAQTAKQVIIQRVRDAEKDIIYEDYKDKLGEIIHGIVRRFEKKDMIIDLGRTEAVLPQREQIPRENFRPGDRIRALIIEIQRESRGPQVVLSRTSPAFLAKLFETEVPEIYEGIVTIESVAREPGSRSKIAVQSNDSEVDPVGACVGMKGSRVQSVVQELRGEKIDIVPWSEDIAANVVHSLSPAEVIKVILDEKDHSMEVVVPDDQLSLAIGRKGQNVRLAVELSGWNIDIQSESEVEEQVTRARSELSLIEGLGDLTAEVLIADGYRSLDDLINSDDEDLATLPGMTEQVIADIKAKAAAAAENLEEKLEKLRENAQEQTAEGGDATPSAGEGESSDDEDGTTLENIEGVGPKTADLLRKAGITSHQDVLKAGIEGLKEVDGIGPAKAEKIFNAAKE